MSDKSKKELIKKSLPLIDKWLDYQTYIKEIPGVAVGIFFEDETIFKKEYGYADIKNKEKLNGSHIFRIASHSKLFTATAIMKLYHEEKLSIDDKVSKYLPWFTSEKDENLQHVRIRHLLTHSSGMTRDGLTAHWTTHKFPNLEEIQKQITEGISFYEANELLKYSNFGYTILGQIIEQVSGTSYHDFIKKEILEPLNMVNTVTEITDTSIGKHAIGYGVKFPNKPRKEIEHVSAEIMHSATGLSSNVEDLIKFYQGHFLGNDKLFPDYIKREMQRVHFKSKLTDWGLGFSIAKIDDDLLVGHGGGYPGFITRSGIIAGKKIILVVLTNAIDGPAATLLWGINKIINYVIQKEEKFESIPEKELPDLSDVIGFYESEWGISLFDQIGSKLVLIGPSADNPTEGMKIYNHKENLAFISPDEPYNASPGELVEFIDGPDGQKIFVDSHKGKSNQFKYEY
ncbi:MAG: beta-lactamase family protein [Asgard group archaeon]|nr:beta-lactamase family protein [Asgard group archaeon]